MVGIRPARTIRTAWLTVIGGGADRPAEVTRGPARVIRRERAARTVGGPARVIGIWPAGIVVAGCLDVADGGTGRMPGIALSGIADRPSGVARGPARVVGVGPALAATARPALVGGGGDRPASAGRGPARARTGSPAPAAGAFARGVRCQTADPVAAGTGVHGVRRRAAAAATSRPAAPAYHQAEPGGGEDKQRTADHGLRERARPVARARGRQASCGHGLAARRVPVHGPRGGLRRGGQRAEMHAGPRRARRQQEYPARLDRVGVFQPLAVGLEPPLVQVEDLHEQAAVAERGSGNAVQRGHGTVAGRRNDVVLDLRRGGGRLARGRCGGRGRPSHHERESHGGHGGRYGHRQGLGRRGSTSRSRPRRAPHALAACHRACRHTGLSPSSGHNLTAGQGTWTDASDGPASGP